MGDRGHVLEHEESSRIWRKIATSIGHNADLETGALLHHSVFPKETPVTRKLVIEHHNMDGVFVDAGAHVAEVINNLGTQDCPEVHRHLDELIRVLRKQSARPYRWRVVEEKPAGRPAKRGDLVRTKFDSHYVVVGGSDWAIKVVPLGEYPRTLHIKKPEDTLMHLTDGAPVTGYDPS